MLVDRTVLEQGGYSPLNKMITSTVSQYDCFTIQLCCATYWSRWPRVIQRLTSLLWKITTGIFFPSSVIHVEGGSGHTPPRWHRHSAFGIVLYFKIMTCLSLGLQKCLLFVLAVKHIEPRQNVPHFADNIFKCIFWNENLHIDSQYFAEFCL